MKLIILGSGTGNPSNDRASPALVLYTGSEITLLDIGPGTLRQLARIGITHERINRIFITHFHPDHTGDLVHFLFATKDPLTIETREPFLIAGPRGLETFIRGLQTAYGKWLDVPSHIMRVQELDTHGRETRKYENYRVETQSTKHTSHSLAYRIEGIKGHTLVYSGDTEYCQEIISLAKNCDLLILECSFPDDQPVEGHMTPSEAGRVATLAGVKKLLLLHFYPEVLATDIAISCRKTYKGELILARDLMHILLGSYERAEET
jgi:ribonuclease BN (tRNA processing enzyme)